MFGLLILLPHFGLFNAVGPIKQRYAHRHMVGTSCDAIGSISALGALPGSWATGKPKPIKHHTQPAVANRPKPQHEAPLVVPRHPASTPHLPSAKRATRPLLCFTTRYHTVGQFVEYRPPTLILKFDPLGRFDRCHFTMPAAYFYANVIKLLSLRGW